MESGAITGYIDVAQLVLYAFWIFFALLVLYLRREDKREGYPLDSDLTERSGGRIRAVGYPDLPPPKSFLMHDGSTVLAPKAEHDDRELKARPVDGFPGSPLEPIGDPMQAELGPGAYALRADVPDAMEDGTPKIVPLRSADGFSLVERDPDPRGMTVYGADRAEAGTVSDVWVDRMECLIRYLEVDAGGRKVLVPINFAELKSPTKRTAGWVKVGALLGEQFGGVPALKNPEQITMLEEEKVTAYFGAGTLYATPGRAEPLL